MIDTHQINACLTIKYIELGLKNIYNNNNKTNQPCNPQNGHNLLDLYYQLKITFSYPPKY